MKLNKDERVPTVFNTELVNIAYVNNLLLVNTYQIEVGFFATQQNEILHQIAIDKIQLFFQLLVNDSVMINSSEFSVNQFSPHNNIIELPGISGDQMISSLLYLKLISIVGDDLDICFLSLSSDLGSGLIHTINNASPELQQLIPTKDEWWKQKNIDTIDQPWWLRPDTATYDRVDDAGNLYYGNIRWEDMFEEELSQLKPKKKKLKVIPGGKNGN